MAEQGFSWKRQGPLIALVVAAATAAAWLAAEDMRRPHTDELRKCQESAKAQGKKPVAECRDVGLGI